MRLNACLVALCALVVATGVARADGSAVSACSSPGPHLNFLSIFVNVSTQAEIVTCEADPVTFSIGSFDTASTVQFVSTGMRVTRLRVVDNHPSQDIVCSIYARSRDGINFVSGQVSTTGTGDVVLAPGNVLTLNPGADTAARVTLQCVVPPPLNGAASGIVDFHTDAIVVAVPGGA